MATLLWGVSVPTEGLIGPVQSTNPSMVHCLASLVALRTAMASHPLSYHGLPPGSFPPHPCWLLSHSSHGSCFIYLGPLVTPTQRESSFLLGLLCSCSTLWKVSLPPVNFCFFGKPHLKIY